MSSSICWRVTGFDKRPQAVAPELVRKGRKV
jgi:hypothetical protein